MRENLFGKTNHDDSKWVYRTYEMHYKGIIKYLDPPVLKTGERIYLLAQLEESFNCLEDIKKLDWDCCINWTKKVNPKWLPFLKHPRKTKPNFFLKIFRILIKRIFKAISVIIYGY